MLRSRAVPSLPVGSSNRAGPSAGRLGAGNVLRKTQGGKDSDIVAKVVKKRKKKITKHKLKKRLKRDRHKKKKR